MTRWRVALIDSCGARPKAFDAACFVSTGRTVERRQPVMDRSGHGSRIAELLERARAIDWLLGQVFTDAGPTSGAAVAAAIDWAVGRRAQCIHLSLGLQRDRSVLAAAVARALAAGCILVAASPARGAPAYPAAYGGVIRATGDARCAPGQLSHLGPWFFGACPRSASAAGAMRAGASVGAAWVTHAVLGGPASTAADAVARLTAAAAYVGAERKTPPAAHRSG